MYEGTFCEYSLDLLTYLLTCGDESKGRRQSATNSDFIIPISSQPNVGDLRYLNYQFY